MKCGYLIQIIVFLLLTACSIGPLLPKAMITFKVIDELGNPISGIEVGAGFGRNTGSGSTTVGESAVTDLNGKCAFKGNSLDFVTYVINKHGFYGVSGEYKFKSKSGDQWQPWNPEIKVVLRKIENPVPMYARRFGNVLPVINKDVGCDLLANDWVKPYGTGTHSDIIFHLKKQYVSDKNYSADLFITFPHGAIKYDLDMYHGSEFKLPRYAPSEGFEKRFERHVIRLPERALKDDRKDNTGYVFRIRSTAPKSVIYGKIQGDFGVRAQGAGTAGIDFTYYLNPDHTRNLEFDPKRNLFTDLKSFEQVGL